MTYKVKRVKLVRLCVISIFLLIVTSGLTIYLSTQGLVEKTNLIFPVLLFGGIIGSLILFYKWNDKITILKIDDKGIWIDKILLNWIDIISYKIRDDSPEFLGITIWTTKSRYTVVHRRKFDNKDDFKKFIGTFQIRVMNWNSSNENRIIEKPSIWDSKWGKYYGYVIILFNVVGLIGLLTFDLKPSALTNYLIFLGISIPILVRIFKRR